MNFKIYKPILELVLLALLFYIVHNIGFIIFDFSSNASAFQYSLEQLYGFFLLASILLLFILIKVKQVNIDNVGYTFLIVTSLKTVVSYFVVRPILQGSYPNQHSDKINFFVIFILFLTLETTIMIRLLNNNQQSTNKL